MRTRSADPDPVLGGDHAAVATGDGQHFWVDRTDHPHVDDGGIDAVVALKQGRSGEASGRHLADTEQADRSVAESQGATRQTRAHAAIEALRWGLREADRGRSTERKSSAQHHVDLVGRGGGEDGHVGDRQSEREVEDSVVACPVIAGDAGSIEDDGHGKVVHSDVVGRLIDRPGEEGRVDGDNGPQAAHGHPSGSGHLVLLGDTHVDEAIWVRSLKWQEAGGARHGRRQGNDPWVLGRSGEQGARERIGVGGWGDGRTLVDGAAGGHHLDVVQALNLVCLGGGIATTLLGEHVDHDGSIPSGGIAQGLFDSGDVMAVDGSGIANAEGLEEGVRSDKLTQSAGDTVDARIGHFAHGWDLPEDVPEALARLNIGRVEPQARQRLRQLRDGRGITAAIVVEDDDHPSSGMTEVVERLVGHPASEGSVTDDGHDPPLATMAGELALELVGGRHPIGIREHRRGMRVLDPIVLGFRPIGVTREASLLPEVLEAIAPAREELVDIGLMAGVPQDGVSRRVEDPMESECQLHDSEIGSEMPASCGHRLDDEGPNLLCELFELLSRQRPEVPRCLDLRKDHARLTTGQGYQHRSDPRRSWHSVPIR